ncbi:MAG: hypothetical protein HYU78_02450 [Rhodocyclales bacterium]|nr:hypothetical protein [Rhodocyclales bacterium]
MNRGGNKQRGKVERRATDDRRLDSDRRLIDVGAPERRLNDERRQVDQGPPERRLHADRRDAEKGPPPGWKDRRRTPERRVPEVAEIPFEDWVRQRAAQAHVADDSGKPAEAPENPDPRDPARVGK